MSNTEFDPLNSEIWNCDKLFEFSCPQSWQGLTETPNPNQRYCQSCQKNVHLCSTPDEFITNGKLGYCVAIPVELVPNHALMSTYMMGILSQEDQDKDTQTRQKFNKWWRPILSQKMFFTSLNSNLALTAIRRIMTSRKFRKKFGFLP